MSAVTDGSAALKNFASQLKSIIDLSDELDRIGSLDNLAAESQTSMASAKADADAAQAESIRLKDEIVSLKVQAEQIMNDANSYVATSEAKANADATALIDAAKANADVINANAQALAQKLVSDAGAKITELQQQEASLTATIAGLTAALASVNADTETATAKLQSIKDSIAKLAAA